MKKIFNFIFVCTLIFTFVSIFPNYVEAITLISENQTSVKATSEWLDEVEEPTDYDYSFAVVGDIQNVTYKYPEKVDTIYGYIASKVKENQLTTK